MVVLLSLLQLLTAMLLTFTPSSFAIPYYHTKCSKNAQVEYHTHRLKCLLLLGCALIFKPRAFALGFYFVSSSIALAF